MGVRFDGKRALVTGAGAGIGRGIVKSLVECGAETYGLSKTLAHLQSLKEELPSVHIVQADLTDWEQTRKAVEYIGPIDLLVNNAGVFKLSSFLDVTPDEIDGIFDVNFKAVFNVSQITYMINRDLFYRAVRMVLLDPGSRGNLRLKRMVERQTGGSVVNISSIVASMAMKDVSAYSSSKAAMDCLTRVMALELGPHKIRVNSVKPTVVMTEMVKQYTDANAALAKQTPLGRCAEVQDVVDVVLFLLSDKAAMIHGTALPVDGGLLVH